MKNFLSRNMTDTTAGITAPPHIEASDIFDGMHWEERYADFDDRKIKMKTGRAGLIIEHRNKRYYMTVGVSWACERSGPANPIRNIREHLRDLPGRIVEVVAPREYEERIHVTWNERYPVVEI